MNELCLFTGAGGGILGGVLLGWRTVCAVEIDPYARRVLLARQNDGCLPTFPVFNDVCAFDGSQWRGCVDIVTGGFPCQDISAAGRGAGITGERSGLWKEMARIIGEVRPRYVLVENSPVLTSRGLGVVLGDLAALGYDARWGVLGAHHAGAPHRRDRIWIMGYSELCGRSSSGVKPEGAVLGKGSEASTSADIQSGMADSEKRESRQPEAGDGRESAFGGSEGMGDSPVNGRGPRGAGDSEESTARRELDRGSERIGIPDADLPGLAKREGEHGDDGEEQQATERSDWWATEPDVGRVAHGVAARVDRLKAIGNGQVPSVVRLTWETLT